MEKDNKNIQVHVRIDRETLAVLERKSRDAGLTRSGFLRYAIHRQEAGMGMEAATPEGKGMPTTEGSGFRTLVRLMGNNIGLLREIQGELGKIGGNLNQAVRNMNTSLKAGARGVDPQDERLVRACSDRVAECIREIGSGIRSLKQIVKKL